jgi:GDP-L-fucose synthase
MEKNAKIYIAGHRGLVGSAIVRRLRSLEYANLLVCTRQDLDLKDQTQVRNFFDSERPEYVFIAAAKVGGILANANYPADFIGENLKIQINLIDQAYRTGVKRLLFLGSSCIYPKLAPQPIREEYLLTGALEETNQAYAIAKIAGVEMCRAYNQQFGSLYLAAMPTNLYGPEDNYDLNTSHVIPALIRKMHEAKVNREDRVVVWGTGAPKRDFLYSDDAADACVYLMNLPDARFEPLVVNAGSWPLINIGTGADLTIRELAQLIADVVEYRGRLEFDVSRPDGTLRKLLDISRLRSTGWAPVTSLRQGLSQAYRHFLNQFASVSN